jgi:hypothetical protein
MPSVLLLDEATSGLDASSSLTLVQTLRSLSRGIGDLHLTADNDSAEGLSSNGASVKDTTVVMTIHQPRSEVFSLFDYLVLLGTGGRLIFSGPTTEAAHFLAQAPCVSLRLGGYDNHGDFILDILNLSAVDDDRDDDGDNDESKHHIDARNGHRQLTSVSDTGSGNRATNKDHSSVSIELPNQVDNVATNATNGHSLSSLSSDGTQNDSVTAMTSFSSRCRRTLKMDQNNIDHNKHELLTQALCEHYINSVLYEDLLRRIQSDIKSYVELFHKSEHSVDLSNAMEVLQSMKTSSSTDSSPQNGFKLMESSPNLSWFQVMRNYFYAPQVSYGRLRSLSDAGETDADTDIEMTSLTHSESVTGQVDDDGSEITNGTDSSVVTNPHYELIQSKLRLRYYNADRVHTVNQIWVMFARRCQVVVITNE